MKKLNLTLGLMAIAVFFGFNTKPHAQNGSVLYFCESYTSNGEVGISDRFHHGYLTVMVKSDYELGLSDVSVQFDKYNISTKVFDYYKKFNFSVTPTMKYIYFSKTDDNDMSFDDPGIYRVFLLDNNSKTVASGLIEIIP